MKQLRLFMAFALTCALGLSTRPVMATGSDEEAISTTPSTDNGNVSLTVNANQEGITNGRILITYNEDELTLVNIADGELFDVSDVNEKAEKNDAGEKVVAFAWANADPSTDTGTALTLTFEAAESVQGKDVTISTTIVELNDGTDSDVDLVNTVLKDVIQVSTKKAASTGDNSNIMLYVGVCVLAAGLGAVVLFVKKKEQN